MPDRRWNLEDLERVARAHALSDAELAAQFPKRRTAEIGRLRDELHTYHVTNRRVVQSDNFAKRLGQLAGHLTCARCGLEY